MEINIADFIGWVILTIIYWALLPEEFKEELGGVIGLVGWGILTLIWVVVFVIIDYNLIDLIKQINITW